MVKIGRNTPCKCGSGKKYKKCCGDKRVNKKRAASKIHFKPTGTAKKDRTESTIIRIEPGKK